MFIPHPLTKVKGRKSKVESQKSKVKETLDIRLLTLDIRGRKSKVKGQRSKVKGQRNFSPQTLDFRLKSTSQRGATLTILTILSILFILSCDKDERLVDLTAVVANLPTTGAKVYVDNNRFACWHHGDVVNVNGRQYSLSVEPGSDYKVAKILGVDESDNGYTAAYPADCFSSITEGGTVATVSVPEVQPYRLASVYDGTGVAYQQLINPMVAHCGSEDDVLKFYNVGCVLKITITNSTGFDLYVHYATLSAPTAFLAGPASVSGIGSDTPTMSAPSSGFHDITVDCSNAPIVLNNGNDTVLYVVSAPFESQSLTLRVLAKDPEADAHGDTVYYTLVGTSASPLSLGRNQMGQVSFEFTDCGCSSETGRCDYLFWGCGTRINPFLITSKEDLIRMRNLVSHVNVSTYDDDTYNKGSVFYKQIVNVDISSEVGWGQDESSNSAIGSSLYPFLANYDGGNHSVTMAINVPSSADAGIGVALFGYVGKANVPTVNVIRNVVTRGSVQGDGKIRNYAGLVGFLRGSTRVVKCVNYAAITNNFSLYGGVVGGICANVGWCSGSNLLSAERISFEACTNYGQVCNSASSDSYTGNSNTSFIGTGGVCGNLASATRCSFVDCKNCGPIQGVVAVGGILGYSRCNSFFSGNNCNEASGTISASRYCGGLLGYVYGGAEMRDVSCNRASVTGSGMAVGGLVGVAYGPLVIGGVPRNEGNVKGSYSVGGILGWGYSSFTDSICNAVNTGKIEATSTDSYVGGIVGRGGSSSNGVVTIVNCKNESSASVLGNNSVGGILGYYDGSEDVSTITSCVNKASISGTGSCVGGLLGNASKSIRFAGVCSNSGEVSGSNYVGGVVGSMTSQVVFNTESVLNTGAIMGSGSRVGGIIGGTDYSGEMSLSNATNAGAVTAKGGSYAGGIIGYCVNNGFVGDNLINLSTGTVWGNTYVGGIMGVGRKIMLSSCKNYADIECYSPTSGQAKGGIVGQLDNNVSISSIDRCVNAGCVKSGKTSGESRLGGILGSFYPGQVSTLTISNCANTGNIISSGGTKNGGLIGYIYRQGSPTITIKGYNSYSMGEVKGGEYTSGLVGYWSTCNLTLTNCYFNGKVTSGYANSSALGYVQYASSLTNCYVCDTTGRNNFYRYNTTNSVAPPSNSSWFKTSSNPGDLTSTVTVEGSTCSSLGDALRTWQAANPTYTPWSSDAIPTLIL